MPTSINGDEVTSSDCDGSPRKKWSSLSKLEAVRLSEKAKLPTRGSVLSAGYDLYSAMKTRISPGSRAVVSTDLKIRVPEGTYGRIAPRSGLAVKYGIQTGAGVVDADYRGPLGVVLFNHGESDFEIEIGDRIAQLICEKIEYPEIEERTELDETARGDGGFGSTGKT